MAVKKAETKSTEKEAEAKEKRKRSAKRDAAEAKSGQARDEPLTQAQMIQKYLEVYDRCMREDPKSFDAKGALGALDQIVKVLGLEAPEIPADDGRILLTLADEVGERGD